MDRSLVSVVNWVAVNIPVCRQQQDQPAPVMLPASILGRLMPLIGDALNRDQTFFVRTDLNSFYRQGDFKVLRHDA
jgi:hypothetical protein